MTKPPEHGEPGLVPKAYHGTAPFVFLSYSHEDQVVVLDEIRWLQQAKFRIWYDEGIEAGTDWTDEIAQALDDCACCLVFVSGAAAMSKNVRNEINYAIRRNKPLIAVYLEKTVLPKGLELRIGEIHAILKFQIAKSDYRQRMKNALATGLKGSVDVHAAPTRESVQGIDSAPAAPVAIKPASCPGAAPQEAAPKERSKRPRRLNKILEVPCFDLGTVVMPNFFIGRDRELAQANRYVSAGQNFLVVGNRRSGKTSFCDKLIDDLMKKPGNKLLAHRLDLQFCTEKLTIEKFLASTLLSIVGEIARWVFKPCSYDDLFRADPTAVDPALKTDKAFDTFVNIFRIITERTHVRDNVAPPPLKSVEFVHFHVALRDIIRSKGWSNFVVFFDEANRLPREISVELLVSNTHSLAQSGMISVYVASPEMAESFQPLRESFSRELHLGPFPDMENMRRLMARYYFDDAGRSDDLPVARDAVLRLWKLSRGVPFLIQMLSERSFSIGHDQGANRLNRAHVSAAHDALQAEGRIVYPA